MNRDDRLPELLAPAGSFEHLKAAIHAGADAVYLGGRQFGARAYAGNLSSDEIIEGLHLAHFHDRKIYLTVNTLIKNKELEEQLYHFLYPLYREGLDGVIVQDPGAASLIGNCFPDMELHGSTQMTITSVSGAKAAARLGMSRVVPARELTLPELKRMKEETGLELEVFIHGALCYCYSGKCLFSSMYGGRSGNRGRCAQPCRLSYELQHPDGQTVSKMAAVGGHLLSPKDLCALSEMPSLIEAGMDSFKIEGRMKNVEYVAGVTSIYRSYLDKYARDRRENPSPQWKVLREDRNALEELYSRGGFTEGYWNGKTGPSMMATVHPGNLGRALGKIERTSRYQAEIRLNKGESLAPRDLLVIPVKGQEELILTVPEIIKKKGGLLLFNLPKGARPAAGTAVYRRRNETLLEKIQRSVLQNTLKYAVTGKITITTGSPVALTLECKGSSVTVFGDPPEQSLHRPVTKEDVLRQMNKTGNLPFYLENLEITLGNQVFLPMSKIKGLRQEAFAKLHAKLSDRTRSDSESGKKDYVISVNNDRKTLHSVENKSIMSEKMAVVYDEQTALCCLKEDFFDALCLPAAFWPEEALNKMAQKITSGGKKVYLSLPAVLRGTYEETLSSLCLLPVWAGIYVHDMGQAQFVRDVVGERAVVRASASFYQWNRRSAEVCSSLFALDSVEIPLELSVSESEALIREDSPWKLEWMAYGRPALMHSAQCVKKTSGLCDGRPETLYITDQQGHCLPAVSHCAYCYSSIWMDRPKIRIGENLGGLRGRLSTVGFHFMTEDEETIGRIVRQFMRWEKEGFPPSANNADSHWNYGIE